MVKTALIIAAGAGARLKEVTNSTPKPLYPLAGVPLIKRIIMTAHKAGIERFVIVTGYAADRFHAVLDGDPQVAPLIEWVHNEQWDQPNGVSVLAARNRLSGPFALLMADHLFEERTLHDLLRQPLKPGTCLLCVDRKLDAVFDMDDATKVRADGDRLLEIGKTLDTYNAVDTGMFLCTPVLFEALEARRGAHGCALSEGIQELAQRGQMRVYDVGDGFWQDVDTPEMLDYAERTLLRRLRKPTDGVVSRHINRPISTRISRWLVRTPLTPNHVTLITFLTGLIGAWLVAGASYLHELAGALLFQLSSILDGCDGEVAKLTFRESRYGSWLDTITDNLTYVAFFFGVVWAHAHHTGSTGLWTFGVVSLSAVFVSILMMYYYLMHTGENGSLIRYNEAFQAHAARPQPAFVARTLNVLRLMIKRDFFTALLLVFAAAGRLDWMFWTVTFGGLAMAAGVFVSTGRLLSRERAARQTAGFIVEADAGQEAARGA